MSLKPPVAPNSPELEFEPFLITDYGVVGDGSHDDTTAFSSALTAAAGKRLLVTAGTFKITSGLTVSSGTEIELEAGATINFSSAASQATLFLAAGTEGSTVSINTASEGATSVTGTGVESGLVAGDWIRVSSDDKFDPLRTNSSIGEQVQVASTASGTVTLETALRDTYTTSPTLAEVSHVTGVAIRGAGKIICGDQHVAVRFDRARACRCEGLRFEGTSSSIAVYMIDSVGCSVDRIDVQGFNYSSNGYGAAFDNASEHCSVTNSTFRDCRHATTTGNSSTRKGISRENWVTNCRSRNAAGDDFDTHAATDGMHFRNCTSYYAATSAFNIECSKASVVGCNIIRPVSHGILGNNASARATEYTFAHNQISAPGGSGVRFSNIGSSGAGSTIRSVEIIGNKIDRSTGVAILVQSTDTFRLRGVSIMGNAITACASTSAAVSALKADQVTITGNAIIDARSDGVGIRLQDLNKCTVTGNTVVHTATGTALGIWGVGTAIDCTFTGNAVSTANKGLQLANDCTNCTVVGNNFRSCSTPLTMGAGAGHISTTADATGAYNRT